MFEPIEQRETAVEACARTIRKAILAGDLAAGERLPPERALAEQLGVTRVTLRSALGQLAAAGLVSVRQGSGYVVQDFRRRGGPDLLGGLASLASERGDLAAIARDLLLVRRHLARAVLERFATGGSDPDRVERAVDRFAEVARSSRDPDELAAADLGVVRALLEATGSPVLGLCFNPIMAVLSELPALRQVIYAEPESNAAGYQLLLAWLRAPNVDQIDDIVGELARRDEQTVDRLKEHR